MEAIKDGTYVQPPQANKEEEDDAPANIPNLMKRHREDVQFHDPYHNRTSNHTLHEGLDNTDITDDPKHMKKLLEELSSKNKKDKPKSQHVHRNSTIGKGEDKNVNFSIDMSQFNTSQHETVIDIIKKIRDLGDNGHMVLKSVNDHFNQSSNNLELNSGRTRSKPASTFDLGKRRKRDTASQLYQETIDEIVKKLEDFTNVQEVLNAINGALEAPKDIKDSTRITKESNRKKRELYIQTVSELNAHDEENDLGMEEGMNPDGIADHHGAVNENTLNDKSNSEFWSSFSSSEEALLNCSGLILNLPLTPHRHCTKEMSDHEIEEAYLANSVTYK